MAGDSHGNPLQGPKLSVNPMKFYIDVGKRWTPSMIRYGGFLGVMFLYFSDWQVFMDKVPFYRTKFDPDKEPLTKM